MLRDSILSFCMLILAGIVPAWAQNIVPISSTSTELSSGPSAHALRISAGDLLDLNVFDTPELSTKLRVDEHGNISLPLAGMLSVSGMTRSKRDLRSKLNCVRRTF